VRRPDDTANQTKTQGKWGKVPRWVLSDKRLSPTALKVLIGYLTYADSTNPARPIWAPPKMVAADLGLATTRGGVNRVRSSVSELVRLGYLIQTSPRHGKITVVAYPVLTAASASELETRCTEFQNIHASEVGARVHRKSVHSASEVGAPYVTDQKNKPEEQTSQTDQHDAAPVSSVSASRSLSQGNDGNGNGRRPHPEADFDDMRTAATLLEGKGIRPADLKRLIDTKAHHLTAATVLAEVGKWIDEGFWRTARHPVASLGGWLGKARATANPPRMSGLDCGWSERQSDEERERDRKRSKQICDSWTRRPLPARAEDFAETGEVKP
jgi:hypothetical protein